MPKWWQERDMWKGLSFTCPHMPLHDPDALLFLEREITERAPDIVVSLGDWHEMDAASKWPNHYSWDITYEFAAANYYLGRLAAVARKANPEVRLIWLPGNHDHNLFEQGRGMDKVRGSLAYHLHEPNLAEWERPLGYQYVFGKHTGTFRLGQMTFAHGWEATAAADEYAAILLGMPYGLTVQGHTHKPRSPFMSSKTKAVGLPYYAANPGTLRDIYNIPWMERKRRHEWGQAVVHWEQAVWDGLDKGLIPDYPMWEAETKVFRMFDDVALRHMQDETPTEDFVNAALEQDKIGDYA